MLYQAIYSKDLELQVHTFLTYYSAQLKVTSFIPFYPTP